MTHYNALLSVYIDNKHTFSINDFLVEIESEGLKPNRYAKSTQIIVLS